LNAGTEEKKQSMDITLSSTRSMQTSLQAIRSGKAGLDGHRQSMLNRVPEIGDWASFKYEFIMLKDLAYLTAKTGDEFALLRGKKEDILFHGDSRNCVFDGTLVDMLMTHKLYIVGHSHSGEPIPRPSGNDREALEVIGQEKSTVISAMSGMCIDFSADSFEIW
jgi:hypothetical protein